MYFLSLGLTNPSEDPEGEYIRNISKNFFPIYKADKCIECQDRSYYNFKGLKYYVLPDWNP